MNKYTILIPCYNDWECLNLLIPNINEISKNIDEEVSILIINDASTIANNLSFNHMTYLKKIEEYLDSVCWDPEDFQTLMKNPNTNISWSEDED